MQASATRTRAASPWLLFGAGLVVCWWGLLRVHSTDRHHHGGSLGVLTAMWALMTLAMMVPTAVPMLATLRNVLHREGARRWWLFLAGYTMVWLGFAVLAAALQRLLMELALVSPEGATVRWLGALVLVGAGLYQFSAVKQRCLSECVAPMNWFLRHWRDGLRGAVRMGVRHGAACVGCCWALMLVALVGGVASVVFMLLATALMIIEKLPAVASRLSVPLGVGLVVAGVLWLVLATSTPGAHPGHLHRHSGQHQVSQQEGT